MEGDTGCAVGILIDLSEPAPVPVPVATVKADQEENKENALIETAAIEVTRKSSQEDCHGVNIENSLKQDLVAKKTSGLQPLNDSLDVPMIEDEVFDFDLPTSPERDRGGGGDKSASRDDDEEVFFGPMGFTEKCIAAGVAQEAIQPLSPLRPEQIAELAKEAFSVAHRIALDKTSTSSDTFSQSPTKKAPFCRNLDSVLLTATQDIASHSAEASASSVSMGGAPKLSAKTLPSPKKRKLYEALSKESSPEAVVTGQGRERSGTFTKDTPTFTKDTPHVTEETPTLTKATPTLTKETPSLSKETPNLTKTSPAVSTTAVLAVSSRTVTRPAASKERGSLGAGRGSIPAPGRQQRTSRLQPPSKLRRYNNSQPNLTRAKAAEESAEDASGGQEGSKTSAPVPALKRTLQPPRATGSGLSGQAGRGAGRQEGRGRGNSQNSSRTGAGSGTGAGSALPSSRGSRLQLQSALPPSRGSRLQLQSALPSSRGSRLQPSTRPLATMQPGKALVQNTPDLPKSKLPRWLPVGKPKALPLEDQVSMCTKRLK